MKASGVDDCCAATFASELGKPFIRTAQSGFHELALVCATYTLSDHLNRPRFVGPKHATARTKAPSVRWQDIRSIGVVHRSRTQQGQTSIENTYFISSLPPKVKSLAKHIRSHWGVENSLHWTLDVTFTEDGSRIRKGNAPELASLFRRLALSILTHDTSVKDSVRGKRLRAGWDERLLEQILTGFQPV